MKILYFSSASCVPCRSVSPIIPLLADAWGVTCETYDVERHHEPTRRYRVTSIPAVVLVEDNGDEVRRVVGTDMTSISGLFRMAAAGSRA